MAPRNTVCKIPIVAKDGEPGRMPLDARHAAHMSEPDLDPSRPIYAHRPSTVASLTLLPTREIHSTPVPCPSCSSRIPTDGRADSVR